MVEVFREVRRVLDDEGTLWLNLGDSYCGSWGDSGHRPERDGISGTQRKKNTEFIPRTGHPTKAITAKIYGLKPKDLIGVPWMVAFALRADGWYLRQDIIWAKKNCMPESVTDRCTKSHEYIFMLSKSAKYYYDQKAIMEPIAENTAKDRVDTGKNRIDNGYPGSKTAANGRLGDAMMRNKRDVWTIAPAQFPQAHFATFPEEIPAICIKAGCPIDGLVLDPFMGAGTTGLVARKLNRNFIGFELNLEYCKMAMRRIETELGMFK